MSFAPIAIVGRGCVLPGALTPEALWDAIVAKRDLVSTAPEGTWGIRKSEILTEPERDARDRTWSERGGYVSGFDEAFDPSGFAGLDPDEVKALDPLFQWVLHTARTALREGRVDPRRAKVGAVFGNLGFPSRGLARYAESVWLADAPGFEGVLGAQPDPRNRFMAGMPAHVLKSALALQGPCFALDAACASSLYAIKYACDLLHDGAVDVALAGAVNKADDLFIHVGFSALSALSKKGTPRPFDRGADGLVPAEGAAFLALKRLEDAVAAGDTIHGVIRGVGLSNDGRTGGLLAPSEEGQVRALRQAYAVAEIDPKEISLVECHATGTVVGDACEIKSMAAVFGRERAVPVGSLKSNLGHLITAAGVAGILKVLEAMRHQTLPPTLHVDAPIAAFEGTRFEAVREARPWASEGPRRAAVSAFGFGGNNAHVVLEEWNGSSPSIGGGGARRAEGEGIAVVSWGAHVGRAADRQAFADAVVRDERLVENGQARIHEVRIPIQGLRFPPNDLKSALGQQLVLLEAAREALDGLPALPRERTGVFVGIETDPEVARYGARWRLAEWRHALGHDPSWLEAARDGVVPVLEAAGVLGTMPNIPANRLNAQFDFGGPSHTVFAGEDSGTAALALAIRALETGELDAAVVGAVDLSCEPVHAAASAALGDDAPRADAAIVLVLQRRADGERSGRATQVVIGAPDESAMDFAASEENVGRAHAAASLVDVATAMVRVLHGVRPGGRPWLGTKVASVTPRTPLGFAPRSIVPGSAVPRLAGAAPRLHVWSGADVKDVLKALASEPNGTTGGPARLVIVAASAADRAKRIERARRHLTDGAPAGEGIAFRASPIGGDVAMVFTGAGAAYAGMGDELAKALPELGESLLSRFRGLEKALGWAYDPAARPTVLDKLWGSSALSQLHVELDRSLGLRAHAAIGYSSGESNALFGFGAWTDLDRMVADAEASGLFDRELGGKFAAVEQVWMRPVQWSTWTLLAPVEAVRAAIARTPGVHLAIVHTDQDCVISGDADACDQVIAAIGRERALRLDYDLAVHVPEAEAVKDAWWSLHARAVTPLPGVRFYSNGARYEASRDACADAITAQVLGTLDFRATIEKAYADGVRTFVEHGPRDACARWIRQILGDRDHLAVSWDRRGRGVLPLFETLAALVAAGVAVDHETLSNRLDGAPRASEGPMLTLPAHPAPVRPPAAPAREVEPVIPSRELEPIRKEAPGPGKMIAAPALPPVSQVDNDVPVLPLSEGGPLPSVQDPRHSPRPVGSVVRSTGGGGVPFATVPATVLERHRAYQAELGRVHQEFLAQQQALHEQFLRVRQNALIGLTQIARSSSSPPSSGEVQRSGAPVAARAPIPPPSAPSAHLPPAAPRGGEIQAPPPPPSIHTRSGPTGPTLTREQLEIHASGRISEIFGPAFAPQDDYAVQVRMPEPPLLLADRMVGIDAEPLSLKKGTIWTESDITWDKWYLHDGYVPPGVMIECGQADLMLISWLGIDVHNNKGARKYRLLGCQLTYHNVLPSPGETLQYDIHCDGHANQGPVRLFFFHYDCRHEGELRLTVRGGQAGFFSDQELHESAGILWQPEGQEIVPEPKLDPPPVALEQRAFTAAQVKAFGESRPWECFEHPAFERTKTHNRTPHIPAGRMLFLEEVTHFEPRGGPWKRGYLRVETTIHPDDWFFAGHFKNDPCMPGTLMFDGCLEAMAFFMTALGVTVDRDGWRFQPTMGEPFDLKCRGQVTPTSTKLVYEIFVEEFSAGPTPTLYADLLCTVWDPTYGTDGLGAFHARRVGLQLVPDWPLTSRPKILGDYVEPKPVASAVWPQDPEKKSFRFDYASLMACAWGKPSDAFGEMYRRFDGHRRVARLPGPPYHFMSRLTKIDGELGKCVPGAVIELEYDIPESAWYFDENGNRTMPFAVLLEAALQPCGWLASFVGSALTVDEDLSFRNLDGTGTLTKELFSNAGTLTTRVKITNISKSAGMIIESFSVECFLGEDKVYVMDTVFGFFPKIALENQVGLPTTDAQREQLKVPATKTIDMARRKNVEPRLAQPMLLMLDRVDVLGPTTLRGHKDVDPHEWFFKAHFFQDPVQPGSLGIEAMIQLLQVYMLETGMGEGIVDPRFEPLALNKPLTWKYRGQVVPTNELIQSTMEIKETGKDERGPYAIADASLWVDGKRIYEAKNMGMRIVSGAPPEKTRTVIDPAKDTWVNDHCPTWTVPALPMMSMVDLLAQHADGEVRALQDIKVKRWLVLPSARKVWTRQDGEVVTLLAETETGHEEIASARVSIGEHRHPPASLPPLEGTPSEDPYAAGLLFHGPAFQRLRSLVIGDRGSSAVLDAAPTAVPLGRLHPVLLDAATHGIPHDRLHLWEPKISEDKVAYPAFVPELEVFGPPPISGTVRAEVRYTGLFAPDMPAFEIQIVRNDGTMWARMKLVEACFPKGPLGLAAPRDRRAFLRDRAHIPGLRLSKAGVPLTQAEVEATDWLPGTVDAVYGTRDPREIQAREDLAQEIGVHPGRVRDALPLGLDLDLAPIKRFWTDWFARDPWPVEDLYYALIERFVRRVVLADPRAFRSIEGRSVLYLSNHQVGVESLLFSILASGLNRMPTVTLAKVEHRKTWLGRLIAHSFSYPGIKDPEVITFFDREDKASLPKIIGELGAAMKGPGRSVMVHVEGTRSLSCRPPVEKMSGAFLDLAMQVGAPVVPVRFVGGLPAEPLGKRIEFPLGMGKQDVWFGAPIEPAELAAIPYGERKKKVVAAINALGPANAVEEPLPGDPAFAASVEKWQKERGVDAEHATLFRVLEACATPCAETKALLAAIHGRKAVRGSDWLQELAKRLGG